MASEQFSLCWNNFHSNLSSGFHSLFQDELLVDVTLAVEGKLLKAHKMVLSVCSPYFSEIFKTNPCKHPVVILKDVTLSAMAQLLTFMYRGEVNVRQDELANFIRTAEALQVKGLTGHHNQSVMTGQMPDSPMNGVSNIILEDARAFCETSSTQVPSSKKRARSKHIPIVAPPTAGSSKMKSQATSKKFYNYKNTKGKHSDNGEEIDVVSTKRSRTSSVESPDKMDDEPLLEIPVETQFLDPVTPKTEPLDVMEDYENSQYLDEPADDSLDTAVLLDKPDGNNPDFGNADMPPGWKVKPFAKGETPSTGLYKFTRSRKGVYHLIHDDNYFRSSGKDASNTNKRRYWECLQNRKTGCKARCHTVGGILYVKSFQHNHENSADGIKIKEEKGEIVFLPLNADLSTGAYDTSQIYVRMDENVSEYVKNDNDENSFDVKDYLQVESIQ